MGRSLAWALGTLLYLVTLLFFFKPLTAAAVPTKYADLFSNSTWDASQLPFSDHLEVKVDDHNIVGFGFVACPCNDEGMCYTLATFRMDPLSTSQGDVWWATPLWSPNREALLSHGSSLEFTGDGDLLLRNSSRDVLWVSKTAGLGADRLRLLETGELLLLNTSEGIVWSSLDYPPLDNLFESQPLAVGQKLVAAFSESNYSQGGYELRVEPHQVGLYYTRFGAAEPYKVWPSVTPIAYIQHTNLTLAMFDSSGSVISSINASTNKLCNQTWPRRLSLNSDGRLSLGCRVLWNTALFCSVPRCRPNELCSVQGCDCPHGFQLSLTSDRCIPSERYTEEFVELPGVDYPHFSILPRFPNITVERCKQVCSQNSSCKGAFYRRSSSTCYIPSVMNLVKVSSSASLRNDVSAFIRVPPQTEKLPGKLTPSQTLPGGNLKRLRTQSHLQVLLVLLSIMLVLFPLLLCFISRRYIRKRFTASLFGQGVVDKVVPDGVFCIPNSPRRYSCSEIAQMTNRFTKKIGEGGFGSVYYGLLTHAGGAEVAVKCLEGTSQGLKQFEAEVLTIGSIDHKNLVKLVGYGVDCTRHLYYLVYEFLPNKSLDEWLFSSDEARSLDWSKRVTIALDVARGLSYLHHLCRTPVLHLDIKPQNVVLDVEFRAKICDFGLAKLLQPEQASNGLRTVLRGTPGYIAPEWWLQMKVTEKADVYSFGVLLLELVSGQKTASVPSGMVAASLLDMKAFEQVMISNEQASLEKVLDKRLMKEKPRKEQVKRMIEMGLSCTQADPCSRPSMSRVTKLLEESVQW